METWFNLRRKKGICVENKGHYNIFPGRRSLYACIVSKCNNNNNNIYRLWSGARVVCYHVAGIKSAKG